MSPPSPGLDILFASCSISSNSRASPLLKIKSLAKQVSFLFETIMDMIKGSLPGMKIFAANRTNIIRNIYIGTIWDSMNLNKCKGYFWHAGKIFQWLHPKLKWWLLLPSVPLPFTIGKHASYCERLPSKFLEESVRMPEELHRHPAVNHTKSSRILGKPNKAINTPERVPEDSIEILEAFKGLFRIPDEFHSNTTALIPIS